MRALIVAVAIVGLGVGARAEDTFGPVPGDPASQSFTVGKLQLVALRDAQIVLRNDGKIIGGDAGPAAVGELLKANGLPDDRITLGVDALLLRTGHRVILLDTGLGPKAHGNLLASLRAAGVSPPTVTDVVITHTHGDHVGGLVDDGGGLAFPKAVIRMAAAEWAWMKTRPAAADLVKAIESRVKTFAPGTPIAPGVTPIALDGHTPGHVGFEIVSGERSACSTSATSPTAPSSRSRDPVGRWASTTMWRSRKQRARRRWRGSRRTRNSCSRRTFRSRASAASPPMAKAIAGSRRRCSRGFARALGRGAGPGAPR
jgi:glyoxylase-like metal-dependent hydrolase (beta-lactamase superfamily II)